MSESFVERVFMFSWDNFDGGEKPAAGLFNPVRVGLSAVREHEGPNVDEASLMNKVEECSGFYNQVFQHKAVKANFNLELPVMLTAKDVIVFHEDHP